MHFWWTWPSWVVEMISGGVLALLLYFGLSTPTWKRAAVVGTAISVLYELLIDCHGWDWSDAIYRELGLLIAVVVLLHKAVK